MVLRAILRSEIIIQNISPPEIAATALNTNGVVMTAYWDKTSNNVAVINWHPLEKQGFAGFPYIKTLDEISADFSYTPGAHPSGQQPGLMKRIPNRVRLLQQVYYQAERMSNTS